MRKLLLVLTMVAIPSAMAGVTFFNTQAAFNTYLAGLGYVQQGGTETFEENNMSPGSIIAVDDPLVYNIPNGVFPAGLNQKYQMQSNLSAGNATQPNPRGASGLAAIAPGTGYTPTSTIAANYFVDSLDTILLDPRPAVSLNQWSLLGGGTTNVQVYGAGNVLLGQGAMPTAGAFVGIGATAPIYRINIYDAAGGAEAVDNIARFDVPEPASLMLLAGGLMLLRRR